MREEELSRRVTARLLHRMLAVPPQQRTESDREFIRFLVNHETATRKSLLRRQTEWQWSIVHSQHVRQFEHWLALFAVR